jgi:hypothetical protein
VNGLRRWRLTRAEPACLPRPWLLAEKAGPQTSNRPYGWVGGLIIGQASICNRLYSHPQIFFSARGF